MYQCIQFMKQPRIVFLTFLFFATTLCFSQIQLLDKLSNEPIPFAHIISPGGMLVSTSDINGVFAKSDLLNIKGSGIFIIQHISYNNTTVNSDTLLKAKKLYMQTRENALNEVTVINKKADYLVLKGYFQSYQLDNNTPKYYADGIVEYYIPVDKGNSLKFRLIECRSYKNETMIEAEKKRTTTVSMVVAGVPYIESKSLLEDLDKKCKIKTINNEKVIMVDTSIVGGIARNSTLNTTQVFIDLVAPQKEISHSLFNYTSRNMKQFMTENYASTNDSSLSKSDLESRIEYRKFFFKHKKEDDWSQIDVFSEFYVFERYFISKSEMRDIDTDNFFGMAKSKFTYNYWEDKSLKYLLSINKNISDLLGKDLVLYK